jgi:hypothetical protein
MPTRPISQAGWFPRQHARVTDPEYWREIRLASAV